jgi:hypothetical protein
MKIIGDGGKDWSSKSTVEELVLQTGRGRIDPTHSNRVGGECSETQTLVEGPTQPGMELAGGAKQGRN